MDHWKPANGRITLLPDKSLFFSIPQIYDVFKHLWGAEPDNFQRQPGNMGQTVAQGRRGDLNLTCIGNLSRIDLLIQPWLPPDSETPNRTFQLIEDVDTFWGTLRFLADQIETLILNEIGRVAAGTQFLLIEESHKSANNSILSRLPTRYRMTLKDEEDFIFQINKPFISAFDKSKINCLRKWSVERLQVFSFMVPPIGAVPGQVTPSLLANPQTSQFIGASVSYDVSTPFMSGILPPKTQSSALIEALNHIQKDWDQLGEGDQTL